MDVEGEGGLVLSFVLGFFLQQFEECGDTFYRGFFVT